MTTAGELVARGHSVRVLSRSGGRSTDGVEHRQVDATDAEALVAAAGEPWLYNAVNPAYHRWPTDWPPVAAAQEAGRVRVTEARAADFVGPQVPGDHSHLTRQLPSLRTGRRAWVIGDPDVPCSWAYLPDVAATLATLGTDERALGPAWHVPSAPPRSQRQALTDFAEAMGVAPVPVSGIPWPVLQSVGLVAPMMREIVAIRHQWDQEFVVDARATTETFGLAATPWGETVRATVAGTPVPA